MRIDVRALRSMWRQTVLGTALAMVGAVAMMIYVLTSADPDYSAARFLMLLLVAMPLMLGAAYLIMRFIESLAD